MQINRGEHIQWFVRYHEGDLEPQERLLVEAFLLINPDLQSEFEHLRDVNLKNTAKARSWDVLKKPVVPQPGEERNVFLAKALEQELSKEELQSFNISLQNDETLNKEWALMQLCQLTPEDVQFAKSSLYCKSGEEIPQFILDSDVLGSLKLKPESQLRFESKASLKKIVPVAQTKLIDFKYLKYAASIAAILVLAWILIPNSPKVASEIQLAENIVFERTFNDSATEDTEISVPVSESKSETQTKVRQNQSAHENLAVAVEFEEIRKIEKRQLERIGFELSSAVHALAMTSNESIAAVNEQPKVQAVNGSPTYLSLGDFAKLQLNKTLTGEENPESGLVYATLDQAAKKISEKSGTPVELKLRDSKKQNRDFNIRIGKFGVSHTSASHP